MRTDGRRENELRRIEIIRHFTESATGSVLIKMGKTKVLCTAVVEHSVPQFLEGKGRGWVTAEYAMLPASTAQRKQRERSGKIDGRSQEIQRLLGRSLRAIMDLEMLGERTIWIDCDVLEADGGTRSASITGSYIALCDAVEFMKEEGIVFPRNPIRDTVAAISVGIVEGKLLLDLCYKEDSKAEVDMNVVMTGKGKIIEVQGTAEITPFSKDELNKLLELAEKGIRELVEIQKNILLK